MGAPKYDIWIDPGAEAISKKQYGIADDFGNIIKGYKTHSDLTDIGQNELSAIKEGRFGDTLFGGALKQQTARANAAAKNDYSLGASALARGGNGANAGLLYQRQLDRRMNRNQEGAQDALSRGLVNYTNAAGQWSQTDNNLIRNLAGLKAAQSQLYSAGWNTQRSGTQYSKKSSFWDKLGKVGKVAGAAALGFATGGIGGAVLGGLGGLGSVTGNDAGGGAGGYDMGGMGMDWGNVYNSIWGRVSTPSIMKPGAYGDAPMDEMGGFGIDIFA